MSLIYACVQPFYAFRVYIISMKNPEISLLCGPAKFADVLIHSKLASSRYCFDSHCNANGRHASDGSENLQRV